MNEEPAERARRYIASFEEAVQKLILLKEDVEVKAANIERVSDAIHRYLQDARFYLDSDKATTALASIAYAEGLLDAMNFLELTETRATQ